MREIRKREGKKLTSQETKRQEVNKTNGILVDENTFQSHILHKQQSPVVPNEFRRFSGTVHHPPMQLPQENDCFEYFQSTHYQKGFMSQRVQKKNKQVHLKIRFSKTAAFLSSVRSHSNPQSIGERYGVRNDLNNVDGVVRYTSPTIAHNTHQKLEFRLAAKAKKKSS
jgi:hypothetical protein